MRVVNQITFEAKDDAEALRLAAERLGKDAVILSTRVVKEGGFFGLFQKPVLKVTAGILEDDPKPKKESRKDAKGKESRMDEDTRRENLIAFQKLMEFKERSSGNAPAVVPTGGEGYQSVGAANLSSPDGDSVRISQAGLRSAYGLNPAPQRPQVPPPAPAPVPAPPAPTPAAPAQPDLRSEVGALAQRIDSLLERLAAVETGIAASKQPAPEAGQGTFQAGLPAPALDPAQAEPGKLDERGLESRLRASEVDEKYIRKLLADYDLTDKKTPFTDWLAAQVTCAGDDGGDPTGGRKVMLLGPTGVGKTTTIAKLAAIQALWEHRKVLLLTSDTYRIAAVDQLKTYAKILGVPIEIVFEAESLPIIMEEHEEAEVVLLDTAGRAQRDRKSLEVFEALYDAFTPDAVHLVLAANMKYRDMLDVIEHIPNIPISHLIFTKLDETVSYGAIFNIQQVMGCPVSFLTTGQNVPRDIETASGGRIAEFLMMTEEERKRA